MSVTAPDSTGTSLAPHVEVEGSPVPTAVTDALVELRVLLGVGTVGRCTVRLAAPGFALATSSPFAIGRRVTVSARGLEHGASLEQVFAGVVTSMGLDQRAGATPELVVVAQDRAVELTHTGAAATMADLSCTDVLTRLVAPMPLQASGLPSTRFDYFLRTGTALSCVDQVTRRIGASWVVHDDTFHVWAGGATIAPPVTVATRTGLQEFSVRVSDDLPSSVTVRGWNPLRQEVVVGEADVPTTLPESLTTMAGTLPSSTRQHLAADLGPTDATEAKMLATALATSRGRVLARGRCTIRPDLRPGGTVQVEEMGPGNATYPVRQVEHVYTRTGFHTRFVAGDRDPVAVGTPDPAPGTPSAPAFRHAGLVVGQVERLSLGESGPGIAAEGDQIMAQVSLPGVDAGARTSWARLATVGGGKDSGIQFLPEVGDEVLVGFEDGDLRRPVVLGGLHGAKSQVPTALANGRAVARRRIVSRRGHVIEIGDGTAPADEFVRLHLAGEEVSLRLGKDRADLTMPSGKPLKIKVGDTFLEMDGNGAVKVEGTTVSIKGQQKVTIEGNEVVLKGTQKLSASAVQVELKGQASATVDAGAGQTIIKGGMVQIN
nr:phage baseplate assembly protein V [uncultured Actinotalea sp.]